MSGFTGINQFGSLTVNDQKLTFEDFDKDKNGEITQEEYTNLLKEVKLDEVEFSSIDKDGDKTISEDEFAVYGQKNQMQDAVNEMKSQISRDFSGKTQYLTEVTNALKDFIDGFALTYTGDVSGMADAFKAALPAKYAEIKGNALKDDPETVKSNVLEEMFKNAKTTTTTNADGTRATQELPANTYKALKTALENEANSFVKNYKGDNLQADLQAHLQEFMNTSDSAKLEAATKNFQSAVESLGELDNSGDLKALKQYVTDFLTAALEKNVTVKLGGTTIRSTAAIATALKKFSDSDALKAAMDDIIAGLSTVSKKEQIITDKKAEAEAAAEKKFTSIKGSAYQVNAGLIDKSCITGYANDQKFTTKGKSGHDGNLKSQAREALNNSNLKAQLKQQIVAMLEKQGVPFEKVGTLFENVYNDSLDQTIEGMTSHKTNKAILNKKKKYESDQGMKTLVDNMINNFNTNIAKAIDDMNASGTDMDLQDIDYTVAKKDENGEALKLDRFGKREDVKSSLDTMLERFKSQAMKKAMAMCVANNIEFNNDIFTTIFNNAKVATEAEHVKDSIFFLVHIGSSNKDIANTLLQDCKTNYTVWVDSEKAAKK